MTERSVDVEKAPTLAERVQVLRRVLTAQKLMEQEGFVSAMEALAARYSGEVPAMVAGLLGAEDRLRHLWPLIAAAKAAVEDCRGAIRAVEQEVDLAEANLRAGVEGRNERERAAAFATARSGDVYLQALDQRVREARHDLASAVGESEMVVREWTYQEHVVDDRRLLLALAIGRQA